MVAILAADPAKIQVWVALVVAIAAFIAGYLVKPLIALRDRQTAKQERAGELAAVTIEHEPWTWGTMRVPMYPISATGWSDEAQGVGFPITVKNGSNEKLTNVRFGIRWNSGEEIVAAQVPVLLPDHAHSGTAWEELDDPDSFEPHDFDEVWPTD